MSASRGVVHNCLVSPAIGGHYNTVSYDLEHMFQPLVKVIILFLGTGRSWSAPGSKTWPTHCPEQTLCVCFDQLTSCRHGVLQTSISSGICILLETFALTS